MDNDSVVQSTFNLKLFFLKKGGIIFMETIYTLDDLKSLTEKYGNKNPNIFLLSDMKTCDDTSEAFAPTNVFIDDNGDIIIQVNEHLLKQ